MTVRRRLPGALAVLLTTFALVTSARAQNRTGPTTEDIRQRIEAYLNRNRGGAGPQGLPQGMTPEMAAEIARRFNINPTGPGGKLTPQDLERLKGKLQDGRTPFGRKDDKGDLPPFEFEPRDDPKLDPNDKVPPRPRPEIPGKKGPELNPKEFGPPDQVGQQPKLPDPRFPKKNDVPQGPGPLPVGPNDNGVEIPPWEKPESPLDKARQAAAAVWEKSVGPLDETPAVKKALFDIVDGTGDLKDPDGNGLWDSLTKDLGDGKSFGDLFNGIDAGGDWHLGGGADWSFPDFKWNFNWGGGRTPDIGPAGPPRESWFSNWFRRSPSTSSSSSSSGSSWFSGWKAPRWNIGMPSLDGTWWPVLFVIAALVGGVLLWKWLARRGSDPMRIDPYALGPWPVDPHHLRTRQDVVIAFEHLSVLLCGEVAKTWTHTTIAAALSEVALAEPARAMMLARLYELARYTPIDEPLTTAELAEARRLVCRLAGFSDD